MKSKKYVFAIIMFCVAVGVIYAIAMCFPQEQSQIIILGVAIAVVVIWMVGKMINIVRLNKIMSAPIPLLYEEKTSGFIYRRDGEDLFQSTFQTTERFDSYQCGSSPDL